MSDSGSSEVVSLNRTKYLLEHVVVGHHRRTQILKISRNGFCRNPMGIYPNKFPGEFSAGFFGGVFGAFFLGSRMKNPNKDQQQHSNQNFGSFAGKIHTARVWP